ncbi:MAG: hypothetical protein ACTSQY_02190, partial [Candidatus Odinarchaeia archaeon]
ILQHENKKTLLILNIGDEDNLKQIKSGLWSLKRTLKDMGRKCAVFKFGVFSSEEENDLEFPHIKIDQHWFAENPQILNEFLRQISIRKVDLDLKKLRKQMKLLDNDELSRILIKYLGPTSLIEDISLKVDKSKLEEKGDEAISLAAGIGSFVISSSPTLLILKGLKYITGFYSILKKRKDKKTREFIEKWDAEVKCGYTPQKLSNLLDATPNKFTRKLRENDVTVILNATNNTIYDFFFPILLYNILEQIHAEQRLTDYIVFENMTYFSKFDFFIELFNKYLMASDRSFNLISSIPTQHPLNVENTEKILIDFLKYDIVYFDVASNFLTLVIGDSPLSETAFMLNTFSQFKSLIDEGILTFIYFSKSREPNWEIVKIPIKFSDKFKFIFRS